MSFSWLLELFPNVPPDLKDYSLEETAHMTGKSCCDSGKDNFYFCLSAIWEIQNSLQWV